MVCFLVAQTVFPMCSDSNPLCEACARANRVQQALAMP